MSNKKQYWTDIEEELVLDYQKTDDHIKRSIIINKLYNKLRKMASSILFRYFRENVKVNTTEAEDNINDAICKGIISIDKYDQTRNTKSYSYIQTVIKRHYYDIFYKKSTDNKFYDEISKNNYLIMDLDEDERGQFNSQTNLWLGIEDQNIKSIEEYVNVIENVYNYIKKIYDEKNTLVKNYTSYSPYQRKCFGITNTYSSTLQLNILFGMCSILENMMDNKDFFSYEKLLSRLYIEYNINYSQLYNFYVKMGWDTINLKMVWDGLNDNINIKEQKLLNRFNDWMYDDFKPVEYHSKVRAKNEYLNNKRKNDNTTNNSMFNTIN